MTKTSTRFEDALYKLLLYLYCFLNKSTMITEINVNNNNNIKDY